MFDRKEIEMKVIDVVTETLALEVPANLEDSFREDLEADSIDIVTLMVCLQEELGHSFEVNDLHGKNTLLDVVNFIEKLCLGDAVPA